MSTRLHIGNIPSTIVEEDLKARFVRFGLVETGDQNGAFRSKNLAD